MTANKDEMAREVLQTHCDVIIMKLEKAVQAAAYAKHIKSHSTSDKRVANEAARTAKIDYIQTVRALYSPEKLPPIYTQVYDSAILKPSIMRDGFSDLSASTEEHSIYYQIEASRIIRQLNEDFLPNKPRDLWVYYSKPHLDFSGEITNKRVGSPDYKICWLDEEPMPEQLESKTIYLDINKEWLFYAVLDPNDDMQIGNIDQARILNSTLKEKPHNFIDNYSIYAEIEVLAKDVRLKRTIPSSEMTEEDEAFTDLQEHCTAIIDRLIDAVYAEMYRKYLPENIDTDQKERAQAEAHNRYEFYIGTVQKLYGSEPIPPKFERIYQDAIKRPHFNHLGKLLRHSINVGGILSQLDNDFVLKNKADGIKWLVYNKLHLDFLGNAVEHPISMGAYEVIELVKHANGLSYRVRSPKRDIQTGELTLDTILNLLDDGHIEKPDGDIYVGVSEFIGSPFAYYTSFIMAILSHPIVQVVARALLVIGAALALTGIAIGVGAGMVAVGAGVSIAGFFARKDTLTPDFFAPDILDEDYEELYDDKGLVPAYYLSLET